MSADLYDSRLLVECARQMAGHRPEGAIEILFTAVALWLLETLGTPEEAVCAALDSGEPLAGQVEAVARVLLREAQPGGSA